MQHKSDKTSPHCNYSVHDNIHDIPAFIVVCSHCNDIVVFDSLFAHFFFIIIVVLL